MKKQALKVLSLASFLIALAVVSAYAQIQTGHPLKMKIPFAFTVSDKTLPAGVYNVSATSSPLFLFVKSEDGRGAAIFGTFRTQAQQTPRQTKLVFRRYGDRYFLAQVWVGGNAEGRELPRSRTELEAANGNTKHLAHSAAEPEIVYVTAE